MQPVGVTKKGKKGQKLSWVKLAICPDHPRRHRPLTFCMRGRVREVVIYFKVHENRSRRLVAVGGRKSPSPIDKAHGLYNSLYYRTSRDEQRPTDRGLVCMKYDWLAKHHPISEHRVERVVRTVNGVSITCDVVDACHQLYPVQTLHCFLLVKVRLDLRQTQCTCTVILATVSQQLRVYTAVLYRVAQKSKPLSRIIIKSY